MRWYHIVYVKEVWYINGKECPRPVWLGEFPVGESFGIWVQR